MIALGSPPISLSYVSSGLFVAHDEWIHADRVIDSWELIYMLNGAVHMRQADASYTLEKGDLLLLRPGVPHGGVQSSPAGVSFYWVHFLVSDATVMARFPTRPLPTATGSLPCSSSCCISRAPRRPIRFTPPIWRWG